MGNIQMEIQQSFCVKYELEKQHFTAFVSAFNSSGITRKAPLSSRGDDLKGLGKRAMRLREKEKSDYINFNGIIAAFNKLYDSRKDFVFPLNFLFLHFRTRAVS